MITIDKGIVLPEVAKSEYPFAQMEAGDSFMVPGEISTRGLNIKTTIYKKKNPDAGEFEVHLVEGGVRVWRTS